MQMAVSCIRHPCAPVHQPSKTIFHEQVIKSLQKVIPELIDDDQHRQAGFWSGLGVSRCYTRDK